MNTPVKNGSLSILVVDDNRDSALVLTKLLRAMGHKVLECFDGKTAIEEYFKGYPEVVLLDLGMPFITGYEVCRAIRNTPEGSKATVIAQTGRGQILDRIESQVAGFDYHLAKPIDVNVLEKILATCRDGMSAQGQ